MTKLWAALNLLGLLCSVVGGVLLFLSFTLKASNYRFVEKSDHSVAICLNDRSVATGIDPRFRSFSRRKHSVNLV